MNAQLKKWTAVSAVGSRVSRVILVFCYVVVQLWWYVSIPVGQSPEEPDHVGYANHLAKTFRLPIIGKDRIPLDIAEVRWQTSFGGVRLFGDSLTETKWEKSVRDGSGEFSEQVSRFWIAQAAQAPLSYLPPAITMWLFRDSLDALDRWHISRLWSVILGFPAVLAGWYLGRKLWPGNPNLGGFVLAGWTILLPAAGALRSVASNDSLSMSFAAWIVALIIVWRDATPSRSIIIGSLLAGGLLTKAIFVPLTPVVMVWAAMSSPGSRTDRLRIILWTMAAPIIAMGTYFVVGKSSGHWHYLDQSGAWIRLWREGAGEIKPSLSEAWTTFLNSNVPSLIRGACLFEYKVSFPGNFATVVTIGLSLMVIMGLILPGNRHRAEKISAATIGTVLAVFMVGAIKEVFLEHGTFFNGKHWMVVSQLPLGVVVIVGLSRLVTKIGLNQKRAHFLVGVVLMSVCLMATWHNIFLYQVVYTEGLRAYLAPNVVYEMLCGNMPWKSPSVWRVAYFALVITTVAIPAWAGYLLSPITCSAPRRFAGGLACAIAACVGLAVMGV